MLLFCVSTTPPFPAVVILLPLKDIIPNSPIVPVCLFLNFPFVYIEPKLSAASSIILMFLLLHNLANFSKLAALPKQ